MDGNSDVNVEIKDSINLEKSEKTFSKINVSEKINVDEDASLENTEKNSFNLSTVSKKFVSEAAESRNKSNSKEPSNSYKTISSIGCISGQLANIHIDANLRRSFPIWVNKKLCWLNSSMGLLLHSNNLWSYVETNKNKNIILVRLFKIYKIILALANHRGKYVSLQKSINALLNFMQDVCFDHINSFHGEVFKSKDDSPIFTLWNLIKECRDIQDIFYLKYNWSNCRDCLTQSCTTQLRKPLVTFGVMDADFKIEDLRSRQFCRTCNKLTIRNLEFDRLPCSFIIHFMKGFPHNNVNKMDFFHEDSLYKVRAIIQWTVVTGRKHFRTWVRDCATNFWLDCNDLQKNFQRFSPRMPQIAPSEIHVVMWEKNNEYKSFMLYKSISTTHMELTNLMLEVKTALEKKIKAPSGSSSQGSSHDAKHKGRGVPGTSSSSLFNNPTIILSSSICQRFVHLKKSGIPMHPTKTDSSGKLVLPSNVSSNFDINNNQYGNYNTMKTNLPVELQKVQQISKTLSQNSKGQLKEKKSNFCELLDESSEDDEQFQYVRLDKRKLEIRELMEEHYLKKKKESEEVSKKNQSFIESSVEKEFKPSYNVVSSRPSNIEVHNSNTLSLTFSSDESRAISGYNSCDTELSEDNYSCCDNAEFSANESRSTIHNIPRQKKRKRSKITSSNADLICDSSSKVRKIYNVNSS